MAHEVGFWGLCFSFASVKAEESLFSSGLESRDPGKKADFWCEGGRTLEQPVRLAMSRARQCHVHKGAGERLAHVQRGGEGGCLLQ